MPVEQRAAQDQQPARLGEANSPLECRISVRAMSRRAASRGLELRESVGTGHATTGQVEPLHRPGRTPVPVCAIL
jgi:hypothetical protein